MSTPPVDLSALAEEWCTQLPASFVRRLAAALRSGPTELNAMTSVTVTPTSSAALQRATTAATNGDAAFLAGLLIGHLNGQEHQATVTPVWTGPASAVQHDRLTIAVLSDLIAEAQHELLLVSYATIPSPAIRAALVAAQTRGVKLTLLLERQTDNPGFRGRDDPLPEIHGLRLHWPAQSRGHEASMHAKLLVIDRRVALVGSANLTGHGLERNLECGVLIRGGSVPALLVQHVLTAEGLVPVP